MESKVLIVGAEFNNQGAYLMLRAAIDQVVRNLNATPVLSFRVGTGAERSSVGAGTMLPSSVRLPIGNRLVRRVVSAASSYVDESGLAAVLDASGFRYGDQWAHRDLRGSALRLKMMADQGIPVYMLPQALGPFEISSEACSIALESCRLIFARDPSSLTYAQSMVGDTSDRRVHQAPDFTCLVKGVEPVGLERHYNGVPIVPNWNILERASSTAHREAYVSNLVEFARAIERAGYCAYGLCHEGARDRTILDEVAGRLHHFDVVDGLNGLELKFLLGRSPFVVVGRFHAAVSALCQGVPAIMHGWSHKYVQLARDFGVEDLLADPYAIDGRSALAGYVEAAADRGVGASKIAECGSRYRTETVAMWDKISSDLKCRSSTENL